MCDQRATVEDAVAEAIFKDIMTEFSKFVERYQPTNIRSFINFNEYTQKENYTYVHHRTLLKTKYEKKL